MSALFIPFTFARQIRHLSVGNRSAASDKCTNRFPVVEKHNFTWIVYLKSRNCHPSIKLCHFVSYASIPHRYWHMGALSLNFMSFIGHCKLLCWWQINSQRFSHIYSYRCNILFLLSFIRWMKLQQKNEIGLVSGGRPEQAFLLSNWNVSGWVPDTLFHPSLNDEPINHHS